MQIPTNDHLWALGEHLLTVIGIWSLVARFAERKLKLVVQKAVRAEISPIREKVEEIYPWYQVVSRAVGKKANGAYVGRPS